MRKPKRIEVFLTDIGEIWKERYPDWRFGQLMFNFFCVYGDPFFLEEDEFLVAFQAFCKGENPREAVYKYLENEGCIS